MGAEQKLRRKSMKIRKNMIKIIVSIVLLEGLLITQSQAVDVVNQTSNTNHTQTSQNTAQNTAEQNTNGDNQTEPEISSNANLSNLGIRPYDFTGFRYGTTSYKVEVPKDTEEIEVYASAQHEKATITGTGKKTLEIGENQADVTVTAEDGTKKTYTIYITRAEEEILEEVDNQKEEEKGLATLKMNNLSLSPEFQTNRYQYTVKYIGEDTKLQIETKPTKEDYIVEIVGNENIQEGENLITILVSEPNGNNIATYQVTVNKSLEDKELIAKQEAEKKAQQKIIIIGVVVGIVAIGAIGIIIVVIQKRNRELENEFSGNSYYEEDFYEEEEEEEIPKALKGRRFQEEEEESRKKSGYQPIDEAFEKMPKEELKEEFLKGYTSQIDMNFEEQYEMKRIKGKHKGKRFK